MSINLGKLSEELTDAGIPFGGITSDGVISYTDIATGSEKEANRATVENHIQEQVQLGIIEGDNLVELIAELGTLGIEVENVDRHGVIEYDEGMVIYSDEGKATARNTVGNHIAKVKSRGIVDTDAMMTRITNVESIDIKGNIVYTTVATAQQKVAALAIVTAHDPYNYVELRTGPDGYAPAGVQLGMRFDDDINGTTLWVDHQLAVKAKFPKVQIIE